MSKLRPASRFAIVGGVTLAALGGVSAAQAAVPGSDGVITACYNTTNGNVRIIDIARTTTCLSGELKVTWNQKGVKGDTGAVGPQGPRGVQGPGVRPAPPVRPARRAPAVRTVPLVRRGTGAGTHRGDRRHRGDRCPGPARLTRGHGGDGGHGRHRVRRASGE